LHLNAQKTKGSTNVKLGSTFLISFASIQETEHTDCLLCTHSIHENFSSEKCLASWSTESKWTQKCCILVKLNFEFLVGFASIQYTWKRDLFLSTLVL